MPVLAIIMERLFNGALSNCPKTSAFTLLKIPPMDMEKWKAKLQQKDNAFVGTYASQLPEAQWVDNFQKGKQLRALQIGKEILSEVVALQIGKRILR